MATPPRQVYNDRYEPLRLIARGGMAEVWLARDALLDRMVALKVLFPELSIDRNFVERFRREAQAAANLSHPNIVSVYDWGEADNTYFIVMEYVDGLPLSALIRQEGTLLADRAASIGADVAAALGFAHRNGVIHRDVKPGNVLITPDDHVKVTDFGIARAANTDDHLTQTGAVMGTATYFSPEQAQGLPVDQRSDVYSLGVVLYEMVTGAPPFVADGPVAVAYKHVHEDPVPPRDIVPELPVPFEAIVLQSLAKDVSHRYGSAEELRADLLRFRQGRTVLADPAPAGDRAGRHFGGQQLARASSTAIAAAPPLPARVEPVAPETAVTTVAIAEERPLQSLWVYVVLLLVLLSALGVVLFLLDRQLGGVGGGRPNAAAAAPITIPADIIGQPVATARTELQKLGFKTVGQTTVTDAQHAAGTVTASTPAPGAQVAPATPITLSVASGPPTVAVPNVVDQPAQQATQTLQAAGFTVAPLVAQDSTTVAAGNVISQNPAAGAAGHQGDTVTLTVSDGNGVLVPNEVDKDLSTAEADLEAAGLSYSVGPSQTSATIPQGFVITTSPPSGTAVQKGSRVTVTPSAGPGRVQVPNVQGDRESDARSILEGKGLVVAESTEAVSDPSEDGRVIQETPTPGSTVRQGSTVNLVVGQYTSPSTDATTTTPTLLP